MARLFGQDRRHGRERALIHDDSLPRRMSGTGLIRVTSARQQAGARFRRLSLRTARRYRSSLQGHPAMGEDPAQSADRPPDRT